MLRMVAKTAREFIFLVLSAQQIGLKSLVVEKEPLTTPPPKPYEPTGALVLPVPLASPSHATLGQPQDTNGLNVVGKLVVKLP